MAIDQHQACISACDTCAIACDHCASECLAGGHATEMTECIRLDLDCAALCRVASSAMARASQQAKEICALCATACDACATECERHQMEHCRQCAEACRRCAKECRAMA